MDPVKAFQDAVVAKRVREAARPLTPDVELRKKLQPIARELRSLDGFLREFGQGGYLDAFRGASLGELLKDFDEHEYGPENLLNDYIKDFDEAVIEDLENALKVAKKIQQMARKFR